MRSDDTSDKVLVVRAKTGDRSALAELYGRHGPALARLARSRVAPSDIVDRLPEQSGVMSRRKRLAIALVGALVLVPAAAEAMEEVAPDQVRGTFVDRITDVLPWDRDLHETDRRPAADELPATDGAAVVDAGALSNNDAGAGAAGSDDPSADSASNPADAPADNQ